MAIYNLGTLGEKRESVLSPISKAISEAADTLTESKINERKLKAAGAEAQKEREFRSSEAAAERSFTSGENKLNRAAELKREAMRIEAEEKERTRKHVDTVVSQIWSMPADKKANFYASDGWKETQKLISKYRPEYLNGDGTLTDASRPVLTEREKVELENDAQLQLEKLKQEGDDKLTADRAVKMQQALSNALFTVDPGSKEAQSINAVLGVLNDFLMNKLGVKTGEGAILGSEDDIDNYLSRALKGE